MRLYRCLVLALALSFAGTSMGDDGPGGTGGQSPLVWKIVDPERDDEFPPDFYHEIPCSGDAAQSNHAYLVKVYDPWASTSAIASESGTSGASTWSAVIDRPSGGWTLEGEPFDNEDAELRLYVGGMEQDSVPIKIHNN